MAQNRLQCVTIDYDQGEFEVTFDRDNGAATYPVSLREAKRIESLCLWETTAEHYIDRNGITVSFYF